MQRYGFARCEWGSGSRGADDLYDASDRWLTALERSDWTALLTHPGPELRDWAVRNLWRIVQLPRT